MTIKCAYVPYSYIEYAEKDAAQKLKGYCALTFHVCGLQMKKKKKKNWKSMYLSPKRRLLSSI